MIESVHACFSESSVASHKRSALVGTEDCVFDSVSLCGYSYGVFGVYILASSALTRLVAFMRVRGSKLMEMCLGTRNTRCLGVSNSKLV